MLWVYLVGAPLCGALGYAGLQAGEHLTRAEANWVRLSGQAVGIMSVPVVVAAFYCAGGVLFEIMRPFYT
jgi:hypothetical protein